MSNSVKHHGLRILTDFPFDEDDRALIREALGTQGQLDGVRDIASLRHQLPSSDVLCTEHVPADIATLAPNLRWLQYPVAGIDGLVAQGIALDHLPFAVTTAGSATAVATAEYILGLMLVFARKWEELIRLHDRQEWASGRERGEIRGFDLNGRTVGIVGLGSIGRNVAQRARAFGMRVVATRRSAVVGGHDSDCDELYPIGQLTDLLSMADFVIISVPLSPDTTNLIGETQLRAMRPDAYLINVSRGQVVDETALTRALRERWIAGAGLDVVNQEPLPRTNPLWTLPGVIITPHISGATTGYTRRIASLLAENITRYRAGQPLIHLVDPQRGY